MAGPKVYTLTDSNLSFQIIAISMYEMYQVNQTQMTLQQLQGEPGAVGIGGLPGLPGEDGAPGQKANQILFGKKKNSLVEKIIYNYLLSFLRGSLVCLVSGDLREHKELVFRAKR